MLSLLANLKPQSLRLKKNLRTRLKKCSKVEVRMNQNNIDVKKMRKFNIDLWKFQNVRKLRWGSSATMFRSSVRCPKVEGYKFHKSVQSFRTIPSTWLGYSNKIHENLIVASQEHGKGIPTRSCQKHPGFTKNFKTPYSNWNFVMKTLK